MIRLPLLSPTVARWLGWAAVGAAMSGALPRVERPVGTRHPSDFGEGRAAHAADALTVQQFFPAITDLHQAVIDAVHSHYRPAVLGPWPRSHYTLKVYRPDDYQGLHTDTNTITALLLLQGDDSPEFPLDGGVYPAHAGDLFVFDGHRPHRVHRVPPGQHRVTVAFNLYDPARPIERPDYADALIFGA